MTDSVIDMHLSIFKVKLWSSYFLCFDFNGGEDSVYNRNTHTLVYFYLNVNIEKSQIHL